MYNVRARWWPTTARPKTASSVIACLVLDDSLGYTQGYVLSYIKYSTRIILYNIARAQTKGAVDWKDMEHFFELYMEDYLI